MSAPQRRLHGVPPWPRADIGGPELPDSGTIPGLMFAGRPILLLSLVLGGLGCAGETDAPFAAASPPSVGQDPGHNRVEVPVDPQLFFRDVTSWAGLNVIGSGQGVAVWDVDGDGFDDVLIPGNDASFVLKNRGDGSFFPLFRIEHGGAVGTFPYFLDLTGDRQAELLLITDAGPLLLQGYENGGFLPLDGLLPRGSPTSVWSVATFGDFDGDNQHEVYLGKMAEYDPGSGPGFRERLGSGDCLSPEEFRGEIVEDPPGRDQLFRRSGAAEFTEIGASVGLNKPLYTQAAMSCDLNGDGHLDLLIGTEGNRKDAAFFGNGSGGFVDKGPGVGMAEPTSAMGFDAADLDHNGSLDLYVTDEAVELGDKLYMQGLGGVFTLSTLARGLELTTAHTGWGVGFHDLDNDGNLDLFVANGQPLLGCPGGEQQNLLFRGDETGHFTHVEAPAGSGLEALWNSRAAAFSDLDHDGDLDILVSNVGEPPTVLRNDFASGHWLQLVLEHPTLLPAVGTRITLVAAGKTLRRDVKGTPSYGGSSSRVVHFGLGDATSVSDLVVRWPDGSEQSVTVSGVDRFLTVSKEP